MSGSKFSGSVLTFNIQHVILDQIEMSGVFAVSIAMIT